ncbi:tripartite tricarboxylate transporter permease [Pacificibacter marinus]|uniref:tripartite tricarboxylate transporter permease n=1 Tax=Pacificibacter marinus TaxID=658057 RepID=UPI001C077094|nr:tripartite tricarboxylate transporter permease [Pacificibacter marinus]MBU2868100.1 tripartite tricarboxylate transporter permease [Pacificibacter marinus]
MEALNIVHGMATVLSDPTTIIFIFLGVFAGVFVGALPGLTATTGCALLLPFTFGHAPLQGILMLVGVFCGGIYGGSLSAILLRTPGTPAAAATMIDGFPMSERGEAGRAIGLATVASFVGGIVGAFVMTLMAPKLAAIGLAFGPPEFFALTLFGLAMIVAVSADSLMLGILAAAIGMWITTIGFDPIAATSRYTFGLRDLLGGVELIPILVGLFGVTQVFMRSEKLLTFPKSAKNETYLPTWSDLVLTKWTAVKSALIGVFVGSVPGAGCDIAAFAAYSELKRSEGPDSDLGQGNPKGIVAPEAANNAATSGALIPMLSLGVPGDAVTAVLLGALTIHGFEPGPVFFTTNLDLIYALFAGVIIAQIALLIVGLSLTGLFAKLIRIDQRVMIPVIMFLCMIGSYSVRYSVFDMFVALLFGCIGFLFEKARIPLSPMLLGVVLGTLSEQNLRRSLIMSHGDLLIFVQRPVSLLLICGAVLAIGLMLMRARAKAQS